LVGCAVGVVVVGACPEVVLVGRVHPERRRRDRDMERRRDFIVMKNIKVLKYEKH